jgi:hypothetical protein
MSRIVIIIIYLRHKPVDLVVSLLNWNITWQCFAKSLRTLCNAAVHSAVEKLRCLTRATDVLGFMLPFLNIVVCSRQTSRQQ